MFETIRRLFTGAKEQASASATTAAPAPMRMDDTLGADVVHVCIVSGERMGNVIPVLHEQQATRVVLLHTPEMADRAGQMMRFLQSRQIAGTKISCTLRSFDASSQAAIHSAMRELRLWLNRHAAGSRWCINVTGGTTPMKLALFDAMRDATNANASFIYSDTQHERIDNLTTGEQQSYRDLLDVRDYLNAQGLTEGNSMSGSPSWHKTLTEISPAIDAMLEMALRGEINQLAKISGEANLAYDQRKGPLKSLHEQDRNRLVLGAQRSDSQLAAAEQQLFPIVATDLPHSASLQPLVDLGLLRADVQGSDRLAFPDFRAVHLLTGFWLEWYAARAALKADFPAEKLRHGLEFTWDERGTPRVRAYDRARNELDLCLVHRNRMLLVECKARRSGSLSEAIYKLDSVRRRAGSALSAALIVSTDRVTAAEYRRVREIQNMYFCAGPDLIRLDEFFALWRDGKLGQWQPSPHSFEVARPPAAKPARPNSSSQRHPKSQPQKNRA